MSVPLELVSGGNSIILGKFDMAEHNTMLGTIGEMVSVAKLVDGLGFRLIVNDVNGQRVWSISSQGTVSWGWSSAELWFSIQGWDNFNNSPLLLLQGDNAISDSRMSLKALPTMVSVVLAMTGSQMMVPWSEVVIGQYSSTANRNLFTIVKAPIKHIHNFEGFGNGEIHWVVGSSDYKSNPVGRVRIQYTDKTTGELNIARLPDPAQMHPSVLWLHEQVPGLRVVEKMLETVRESTFIEARTGSQMTVLHSIPSYGDMLGGLSGSYGFISLVDGVFAYTVIAIPERAQFQPSWAYNIDQGTSSPSSAQFLLKFNEFYDFKRVASIIYDLVDAGYHVEQTRAGYKEHPQFQVGSVTDPTKPRINVDPVMSNYVNHHGNVIRFYPELFAQYLSSTFSSTSVVISPTCSMQGGSCSWDLGKDGKPVLRGFIEWLCHYYPDGKGGFVLPTLLSTGQALVIFVLGGFPKGNTIGLTQSNWDNLPPL